MEILSMKPLRALVILLVILCTSNTVFAQRVIQTLPGLPDKLPNKLETGYIGVGEDEEVQLFYFFFESEGDPEKDPFIFWITGGPGCSGLSVILMEIGTFVIDFPNCTGGPTALKLNEYAWTKSASILFIDQPAGTGYSYSNTLKGYITNDTLSTRLSYDFLRKWLIKHPQYLKNPLYIVGESYSGITLPLIVDEVYKGLEAGDKPTLNIKGYALGNPITDLYQDINERVPYAHGMGLLSEKLYQSAKVHCHGNYKNADPTNTICVNDLEKINQCLAKIYQPHILEPWCDEALWAPKRRDVMSLYPSSVDEIALDFIQPVVTRKKKEWCREDNAFLSHSWANDKAVQKALNVREGTQWVRCNQTLRHSKPGPSGKIPYIKDVPSTIGYHKKFTQTNARVLIFSGDHDLVAPHTSTEKWIESLKVPIKSDWRPWFVDDQIGGYTMQYAQGNYELTYATIKGSGHTNPEFRPKESFALFDRWIREIEL